MAEEVNLSRESADRIAESIGRQLGGANRTEKLFDNKSGPLFDAAQSKFAGGVNSLTDLFGKLAGGTANTADAIGAVDTILSKFGGTVGTTLGHAFKELGDGVIKVNNTMKETGQFGVSLGGDLGLYNKAILDSHLTLGEFSDIVKDSSHSLAGLGSNMDKSAKAFLGVAADVVSSDVGRQLQAAGMSAKELAEITQLSLVNKRSLDLLDEKSKREAVRSAADLAVELDLVAQITGKSRKETEAALKKQAESTEVMAAAMRRGGEFASNLNKSTAMMGETGRRLVAELATGKGLRTEEGIKLAATYGEAMPAMRNLAEALKRGNEEEIKRAQIAAEAAIANRVNSEQFMSTAENLGDRFLLFGDVLKDQAELTKAVEAKKKEMGGNVSTEQAMEALRQDALRNQQRKTAEGKPVEGAITSQAINNIDYLGKVAGSVAAKGFKELNDKLGDTAKSALPQFEYALKRLSTSKDAIAWAKEKGEDLEAAFKKGKGWSTETPEEKKKYATGTMGVHNELFHQFDPMGETVQVDGKEAIVPENQAEVFVRTWLDSNGDRLVEDLEKGEVFSAESPIGKNLLEKIKTLTQPATEIQPQPNNVVTSMEKSLSKVVDGIQPQPNNVVTSMEQVLSKVAQPINADDKRFTPERIQELLRVANSRMVVDGKFQNKYNPEAVAKAQKLLDDISGPKLNDTLKNLGVNGIGGAIKQPVGGIGSANAALDKMLGLDKLAQTNADLDAERAKADKTKTAEQPTATPAQEAPPPPAAPTASSSDLKDEIVKLNTTLRELITHTDSGVDKQVRAIKSLSGNRLA